MMMWHSFLAAGLFCAVASSAHAEPVDPSPTVAMVVVTAGSDLLGLSVSVGMGDEFDRQVVGKLTGDGFAIGTRVTSTPDGSPPGCENDVSTGLESSVVCEPPPPIW